MIDFWWLILIINAVIFGDLKKNKTLNKSLDIFKSVFFSFFFFLLFWFLIFFKKLHFYFCFYKFYENVTNILFVFNIKLNNQWTYL